MSEAERAWERGVLTQANPRCKKSLYRRFCKYFLIGELLSDLRDKFATARIEVVFLCLKPGYFSVKGLATVVYRLAKRIKYTIVFHRIRLRIWHSNPRKYYIDKDGIYRFSDDPQAAGIATP